MSYYICFGVYMGTELASLSDYARKSANFRFVRKYICIILFIAASSVVCFGEPAQHSLRDKQMNSINCQKCTNR